MPIIRPIYREAAIKSQPDVWQNRLVDLYAIAAAPFIGAVLDLPPAAARPPSGYEQSVNLNLVGQDKFFGPAGQGPLNITWPPPQARQWPIELRTFNHESGLLLTQQDPIFVSLGDVPNPRRAPFPIELRTFTDDPRLTRGQDVFFGAAGQPPLNAPLEPTIRRAWRPDFDTANLLESTLAVVQAMPFAGISENISLPSEFPSELRTWLGNLLESTLAPAAPFVPNEQIIVAQRGYPVDLRSWSFNLLETTLGEPPAPPFFSSQTELPIPREFPADLRTFEIQAFAGNGGDFPIVITGNDRVRTAPIRSVVLNHPIRSVVQPIEGR